MLLKSSHILPLLNSEESSSDFSTVMFYLLVWWIRALFQRNLMWRAVVWLKWGWEGRCVSGGRRGMRDTLPYGTSDITHLLTAHSSLPAASTSISVFFSVLCFFKLWCVCMSSTVVWLKAPPVVFWEGERCAQAYCYSSRCLCVWSALIAELCFWCSCFALVSTWLHIQGLFAAGSSTMSSVVQNNYFYCCCLDLPHKRHDYKNIDVNQILCS